MTPGERGQGFGTALGASQRSGDPIVSLSLPPLSCRSSGPLSVEGRLWRSFILFPLHTTI